MIERLEDNAYKFQIKLDWIHDWLPNPNKAPSSATLHQALINFRDKQFIRGIIKSIFCTEMGLHNTHKLNQLKKQLKKVEAQQTQLIVITQITTRKLNHMAELAKLLKNLYSHSSLADPSFTLTELIVAHQNLDNDRLLIMDALKAAHLHHLSMDLFSPQAVKDIFEVISHPSDLFQIEVSYYMEPENIKLFIQILMVPIDSLLCILKFHPFVLLFTETHSLLPMLNNSLSPCPVGSTTTSMPNCNHPL
jgi:hypothetical protein